MKENPRKINRLAIGSECGKSGRGWRTVPFYHTTLWQEMSKRWGKRQDGWTSGQPVNNSSIQRVEFCCLAWKLRDRENMLRSWEALILLLIQNNFTRCDLPAKLRGREGGAAAAAPVVEGVPRTSCTENVKLA